ncbi:MAG: UDP-glucose 4-epimerase GalE [Methylacidiphilales bacterium]|nr:UDP-glucose 4-epimerase GalE [Candidatus Methylacidiphilales bacterium]MDW8349819.1 UDP-glucose 4-epimerase GalE [Verrucomicrobiae bacterium]
MSSTSPSTSTSTSTPLKIFVTGGAGYIGSICTEELLNAGHKVIVFDNLTEGHRDAVDPRAIFIEGDLANPYTIQSMLEKHRPDAVMHFAASALVSESMRNPSKYFRNNVANGINLLDAMVQANVKKIIFSSTCATYGIPEKIPIDERTPQKPINPYGHSKLMFEQILKWYEQIHGIIHISLRYFNAAGASERYGEDHRIETHLIPNVLKVALGQKDYVEIYGDNYATPDGTCIRDFIHIIDLAQAHILALNRTQSAAYNVGTGEGYSVRQVIEVARKITGHPIPVQICPPRPGDPPRLVASAHKIAAELGWKPRYTRLQPIIESAWKWHQAHPNGYAR